MPLDPSIALQIQSPNPANMISGFVDLGRKKLDLDKSRATYATDVAERKAQSSSAVSKATVDEANVNPLIQQQAAHTQGAKAVASQQELEALRAHAANITQQLGPLSQDPEISYGKVLKTVQDAAIAQGAPAAAVAQSLQGVPRTDDKDELRKFVAQGLLRAQTISAQLEKLYPAPAMVNTGPTVQPVAAANPALSGIQPGTPQGAPVQMGVSPGAQEEIQTDTQGNRYIVQRSPQGTVLNTRQVPGSTYGGGQPGAGPVNLPPNETAETRNALQGERQAALKMVQGAGPMRQLNREIYSIAEGDVQTGKLGGLINKVASATGYNLGTEAAADYNTLGKMLARSNQQLSQSMGPHTNAGLEQANVAGGSTEYDKNTIKKIAALNDALVTGTMMYQAGLEKAIERDGIFGKRKFDQAWGTAMDPDALRLKNAVDNKDKGQIQMILKAAGGSGSPGAAKLLKSLQAMDALESGR